MIYSHLQAGFITAAFLLAVMGCDRNKSNPAMSVDELAAILPSTSRKTEDYVQHVVSNAAASPRAIIFVHVDWSFMTIQRKRLAEFMLEDQRRHPEDPLMFHYVDCS